MLVQGIILSLFLAASAATAEELPSTCFGDSVHTLTLKTHGRSFSYRFAYRAAEDPEMPVVINIPGGPGQGSIGRPLSIPYEFGIVRTDPLGAGCNTDASLPIEEITSEDIADGIVAVVRELQPKHYILYGASYGTMVATIAAAKLNQLGPPTPMAVVLEGVIGRAYTPQESLQGFLRGWERLKSQLPAAVVDALSEKTAPLGFAPEIWGGWLQQLQLYGASPSGGPGFAVNVLSGLDPSAPEAGREVLRSQLSLFAKPAEEAHVALYRSIACREIDGTTRGQKTDMALREGQLVPLAEGFCGERIMTRPFDAAKYQITAPIFYFSGGWDPATPEFQTEYHYESQITARNKTWVRVPTGGHLSFTSNLMDCQDALWKDIAATDGANLSDLLQGCHIQPAPQVE